MTPETARPPSFHTASTETGHTTFRSVCSIAVVAFAGSLSTQDDRRDPGAAGDQEDPHASGVVGACAAPGPGPWAGAACDLTIPIHHCSGVPQSRATRIGCGRGFSGPMDVARRQGVTR
jgi:hypothetical protein